MTKYYSTSDYNKFTCETLDTKIKENELVAKSGISGFMNDSDLDESYIALSDFFSSK